MQISSEVITNSGVAFGTSGARGLVTQFTQDTSMAFASAFLSVMKQSSNFDRIAIGIDNRPSSYEIAQSCAAAAKQFDIEVVYSGVLPTPALAYWAMQQGIPCIMVTGSHIPFDRNGLKFYRPDGEITKLDEQAILSAEASFEGGVALPELVTDLAASSAYIERYASLVDNSLLAGKRIGIYEHSSAGRDIYADLFTGFGVEVVSLERSDEFVPIDTEAVSEEDKVKARNWSKEYQLDAIFSTDGDGDRPLISDESGEWLRGDILGLVCSQALNVNGLATPVSCNTAIELSQSFDEVQRTKIGSPYVIAAFAELIKKHKNVAGFEANGGFLLGSDVKVNGQVLKALPTRDAVLPAIMLFIAAKNEPISALLNTLPQRLTHSDRIKDFPTARSKEIIAQGALDVDGLLVKLGFEGAKAASADSTDGLRMTLDDGRIVHLRPSGNAPELRCYAEANDFDSAKACVELALARVQSI